MMKPGAFTLVLVAGLAPILVFALLAVGPRLSLVRWEPPVLWTKQFGVPGTQEFPYSAGYGNVVTAVSATTTGLYAVGFVGQHPANLNITTSYLFLNRYDLNGNEVWFKHFPGISTVDSNCCGPLQTNSIDSIAVESDSVFIAGRMNGTGFVQRDDLSGNTVWTKHVGGQVSIGSGEVFVGSYNQLLALDLDGNTLWNKTSVYAGSIYAGSGGLYVTGYPPNYPDSDTQAFTSKYDPGGTLVWTRQFDENGFT